MTVADGQLALPNGMRYRVLVLPNGQFMTAALITKLRDLVKQGATVIGPKPTQSPSLTDYPQGDGTVRRLADEIWGNCDGQTVKEHAFGKGRVVWGKTVPEVLASLGVQPDCTFASTAAKPKMAWIHRRVDHADLYFVSNQRPISRDITCTFRISDRQPELWHADTGATEPAPVWSAKDGLVSVPIHFDPAGSVFVVFRTPFSSGDHLIAASWPSVARTAGPKIKIQKAVYEAVDGAGRKDVTAQVAAMVEAGETSIPANNDTFGDPIVNHVKQLRIEYTLDGKPMTQTTSENGIVELTSSGGPAIPPVGMLVEAGAKRLDLEAFQAGAYAFQTARGRAIKKTIVDVPKPIEITGPWMLRFPPHWGAPSQITMPKLISWSDSDDQGVRYFSGTAEYEKEFDLTPEQLASGRVLQLDLGQVKDLAQVTLNGHDLGVWWKPPFAQDVTAFLKPGRNVLKIRITNTWINRLIGDEQYPEDCQWSGKHLARWPQWLLENKPRPVPQRLTFTTWRHYTRDSKLVESGLLGPILLRVGLRMPVE